LATTRRAEQLAIDNKTAKKVNKTVAPTVAKFICPYDGLEFNNLTDLQDHIKAVHIEMLSGLKPIKLNINRKAYQVEVEPSQTLWYVLRDMLELHLLKTCVTGMGLADPVP
jgi:hypothetical protein